jgi:iron complex outermembrane receptor protein
MRELTVAKNLRSLAIGAAVLALLLSGGLARAEPAAADADSKDEKQETTLEEYVKVDVSAIPQSNTIGTKLPVDSQLTPAIVGTVSSELFNEQLAVTLSDVLENVSGLNIQTQNGVTDFFVVRGFDSLSGALVMIDGAAVPEATLYPTYNVQGVEVLKGPGGYLYGADAMAGTVNIVRKQPVANDFLGVQLSGGSFGTYDGQVDWNQSNDSGSFAFRLNGFYRESDGYRDNTTSDHWAVNPSFNFRISERSSINVNFEAIEASYSPDAGLPLIAPAPGFAAVIPNVDRDTSYQSNLDFSDQTIQRIQVDYQIALSDRVTLRNKTYFRDLDWQTTGTLLFQDFLNPMTPVGRAANTLDNQQRFTGNQLEAAFRLGSGRVKHNILAGVEVAKRDNDYNIQFGFLSSLDLVMPVDTDTSITHCFLPMPGLCPVQSGTADSTVIAPYVVDQIEFSPQFHLMLGVRYDDIDFDSIVLDGFNPMPIVTNRSDGDTSPRAGFVWAPNESLSFYASAAESFAPPSPRVVGTREPEESDQVEVGIKKEFAGGKVRSTFAVYEINRTNIAIPDNNGFTQQQGDQRSRGVEFEIAAEPAPGLRTFFSYAFNNAELTRFAEQLIVGVDPMTMQPIYATFDRSGNTPAFAPENLANLWVSKRFGNGWGFGGGARYIDSQFIAEDNAFAVDSALVLDACVFYRRDNWRVNLHLKNLTDEEYFLRGFGSDSVIPAAPAAGYVTIGFDL